MDPHSGIRAAARSTCGLSAGVLNPGLSDMRHCPSLFVESRRQINHDGEHRNGGRSYEFFDEIVEFTAFRGSSALLAAGGGAVGNARLRRDTKMNLKWESEKER